MQYYERYNIPNTLRRMATSGWDELKGKNLIFVKFKIMQAQVIDNHKIIYCDDYPLLTEYFYDFRKLVETYRYRVKQAQ